MSRPGGGVLTESSVPNGVLRRAALWVQVNGSGAIPLYKFLKEKQGGGMGISAIKWNFTK